MSACILCHWLHKLKFLNAFNTHHSWKPSFSYLDSKKVMSSITPAGMDDFIHQSPRTLKQRIFLELKKQKRFTLPLIPMNSTWFIKTAITTAFLGRIGELQLAAGTLGYTFANVTGFSILTGLCWGMEPICGQAHGAKNQKLLHKTLLMTIALLLITTLPITLLWFYMDKIYAILGQQRDIIVIAKRYLLYLLPDLLVTTFLSPLKAYLSSQGKTLPIMLSSGTVLALIHIPANILLSRAKGIEGVALATGLTDLILTIILALYILSTEIKSGYIKEGWWDPKWGDWVRLLSLAIQCCFTGCLKWWFYEIIILLAGRMHDAQQMVAVLTVVLNFDYLLNGFMVSIATCASTRVSIELGAGNAVFARTAAYVSLGLSMIVGGMGGLGMIALRDKWGSLFSHNNEGVVEGVGKMLVIMAMVEVFSFPLGACGGIVRGTSKPWLGMTSVLGYYLVGLPLSVILCFRVEIGLYGLMLGFLVGSISSAGLLSVFVLRIDWDAEAEKVKKLASTKMEVAIVDVENIGLDI